MYEAFIEPFQFEFMQRALLAAALAAIVTSIVGTYVVLKGLGFMGDAIAHSALVGMAAAFRLGGNVLWGAFAWIIPASLLITWISRRGGLRLDTSIGIIYALGFALGLILISGVSGYTTDLFSFLFGDVLGVSWGEIWGIGAVAAVVLVAVALLFKELLFVSYDETMAAASGIPVTLVQYLLPVLIGITTVAAVKTVGVVLVLSLLITPGRGRAPPRAALDRHHGRLPRRRPRLGDRRALRLLSPRLAERPGHRGLLQRTLRAGPALLPLPRPRLAARPRPRSRPPPRRSKLRGALLDAERREGAMEQRFGVHVATTWGWSLAQCVDAWARRGVPAIGLGAQLIDAHGRAEGVKLLRDSGLKVSTFTFYITRRDGRGHD